MDEADWQEAVSIFQDRLETRYLEHIRELLMHPTSSFVVLALDCALIETLQQFRLGKNSTPSGQVNAFFTTFLTTTSFSRYFDQDSARIFYKTIRCGLLHQAEAGETSRVKRGADLPLVSFTTDQRGIIVNTKLFHSQLEYVITEYANELRRTESVSARDAFRKKMNYICRVKNESSAVEDSSSSS